MLPLTSPRAAVLLLFLLGAISTLGFAPFYLYPIPIATLAGLFYFVQKSVSAKQAAWLGFAFGLGFFGAGVSWIYVSLHDFGGMPWWMAGFSTFTFCVFLSLFPALVCYLGRRFWLSENKVAAMLALPLLWVLSEWVRSWIFTGFPWLNIGYSQVPYSPLSGFVPVLGIYGVSLMTAVMAAMLALWPRKNLRRNIALILVTLWVIGSVLKLTEWSKPAGAPISVALLQGNIAQDMKWQPEVVQRTLDQYLAMAMQSKAQLTVLPETALPMLIDQVPADYLARLKAHAQSNGGDVLVGSVELEDGQFYNSMLSYGSAPTQAYRKSHLVPFGEFIPLKGVFGWIYRDWLHIPLTDLSRGSIAQKPLELAGQKVAVNICYEDVFGEEIIRQLPQATILLNASNDAWYGESLAAYQHLQMSQARALETGRMMLRSTNTGATAIIDPQGNVLKQAPHFTTTVLEGKVQGYSGATPYVRLGNWPIIGFCVGVLIVLIGRRLLSLQRDRKKK
ncbi:MAG TPA: apolipoprotein N-acyltransferase [Methylophilaceae bacterium]|nr:apolipoprotein N-acyltransferase [Methylophilaceae bacterium]